MPFTIAEVTDGWHAAWIVLAAALPASCGDDTPESAVVNQRAYAKSVAPRAREALSRIHTSDGGQRLLDVGCYGQWIGAYVNLLGYPLHNSYLQACQENGIIGVGLIVCVMLFVLAHASRCFISKFNRGAPVVEAAVGAVCIAGIVNSCFEAWIVSVGNLATMPFWACVFTFLSLERCPQKARLPQNGVKASIS